MATTKPFIKLDEDLFKDQKIRDLIGIGGYKDFGLYVGLLTVMRKYEEQAYRVPYSALPDISLWDLAVPLEELQTAVSHCVDVGLFNSADDGFWSPRRVKDLAAQKEKSKACRASAERTNSMKKAERGAALNQRDFRNLVGTLRDKAKS